MKSKTFIRKSIIGLLCILFFSSCCCFGGRGINFDTRQVTLGEGVNNFSEAVAVKSWRDSNKNRSDPPHASFPVGE
jgi:hypothetical protein